MMDKNMNKAQNGGVPFFDCIEDIRRKIGGKALLLFLDYEGVLVPVGGSPATSVISESMRQTVRRVAEKMTVVIVSGRLAGDVRGQVRLKGIFYAGSGGLEIIDPLEQVTVHEQIDKLRKIIDEVYAVLVHRLKDIKGVVVEHVQHTVVINYRLVSDKDFPKVERAVADVLKSYSRLQKTDGKRTFEIDPMTEDDKGRTVGWILDYLEFDAEKSFPVYIGAAAVDEAVFYAMKDDGFGILVTPAPRPTDAAYFIRNTEEVQKVLEFFLSLA